MGTGAETVGVVGLGRMGRCLVQGWIASQKLPKDRILFTTRQEDTGKAVAAELGITRCATNEELVKKSTTVLLAVKPQNATEVLTALAPHFRKGQTLVSIVTAVPTTMYEALLPNVAVVRAMPNTPAFVGESCTAVALGKSAGEADWKRANDLFESVGRVLRIDEKLMNAATGLSGCGPAYFYVIAEALADAGIKVGMQRDLALTFVAQTMLGSAKMLLETGRHPAALKDEVTTPAGCTIDALLELEEGKLRIALIRAVVRATERAKELLAEGQTPTK